MPKHDQPTVEQMRKELLDFYSESIVIDLKPAELREALVEFREKDISAWTEQKVKLEYDINMGMGAERDTMLRSLKDKVTAGDARIALMVLEWASNGLNNDQLRELVGHPDANGDDYQRQLRVAMHGRVIDNHELEIQFEELPGVVTLLDLDGKWSKHGVSVTATSNWQNPNEVDFQISKDGVVMHGFSVAVEWSGKLDSDLGTYYSLIEEWLDSVIVYIDDHDLIPKPTREELLKEAIKSIHHMENDQLKSFLEDHRP